ncbi:asparagine--tRNA ligase [Thalassoglobus polymorphus]|uniref:Asparagine--tRNA ligase n=1 Tax=Thalassoglobus polymorphus TaxID=2527994 RepID=A0A517QRN0_9PLAN|nr:asparagine--tRNA ligase [Thalassoglobus polymorphus]QDT34292.1 Asparagine--tRNA ligase [Thalassoglobus polymorphus]
MTAVNPRVASLLYEVAPGTQVDVSGWVRSRRDSKGGFSFIELNDGSCMSNLQIIVDADVPNYEDSIKDVTTGASVRVTGELKESPGAKQRVEMQAKTLEVLGTADAESYPLQKKRHSFEFLREIAHLRPRTNTFGAIARVRNCVCRAIHDFFQERGFLNVQTPIITTSDCEGAGEMFTVTTLPPSTDGKPVDYTQDFFGKHASLTVSGQLEGEIYATAVGPIYTFGPTFRAENSHTTRHLAEFWMVEPEVPFCDLDGNMQLAEDFIKTIVRRCLDECAEDMQFFNDRIDKTVLETMNNILEHEFKRISYTEAVELILNSGKEWEYPVSWGSNLQAEHEKWLTEEHFKQPIIVFDYPRSIKPFYMYCNEDGKTVRAMDVLVPGVGEIIGGSQREHRLDVLEARFQECGLDPEEYWWYLDLRRYGSVPHAGFGLGLERMILLLTGMQNIRDVIPFPRTPNNAEF